MQIFAKGAYQFGPGLKRDGTVEKFVTKPLMFDDMPDKFANDDLFKDCVRLGLVRITGQNTIVEKKKEVEVKKAEPVVEVDASNTVETRNEELVANLKGMKKDELIAAATELNIKLSGDEKAGELRQKIYEFKKEN